MKGYLRIEFIRNHTKVGFHTVGGNDQGRLVAKFSRAITGLSIARDRTSERAEEITNVDKKYSACNEENQV